LILIIKRKIVLICGATGFIGRNIAEYYAENASYDVVAIFNRRPPFSNPKIRWMQADLTNPLNVESVLVGVDILVQAAATTSGVKDIFSKPEMHVTDNAVMNSYIFRMAYERGLDHVIFFSCTIMLASSPKAQVEEDFNANGKILTRYFGAGWTKVYLEKMCEFYAKLGRTKYTAIRHSNVYGPYDKFDLETSHFFGASVTKVMQANDTITIWGNGEETRDILYVHDLVDMVNCVIVKQKTNFAIYNCGYGTSLSVTKIVKKIVSASGKSLKLTHDLSMPTIHNDLILDCTKAKNELGWTPKNSISEGISKTVHWWLENVKKFS